MVVVVLVQTPQNQMITLSSYIETADNAGFMALYLAAQNGHAKTVNALLDWGAEINVLGQHIYTTLHLAAMYGYVETAAILLSRGADVNATNKPMESDGSPFGCEARTLGDCYDAAR